MSDPATKTTARSTAEEALLDAAERLLVDVGYAAITTRKLAEEAVANQQELRTELAKLTEKVATVEKLMRDVG